MTQRNDLPSYRRPPVIEVICGVQFEALAEFSSVHFGKLFSRVASEYPSTQDREPIAEILEGQRGVEIKDQVVTLPMPPLRRVFYVDNSGNYLLQVQPSRFLANWRKQREQDEYPHFEATYDRFLRGWRQFLDFVNDERLGVPRVNQYELTYINHIFEATTPFPAGMEEHLGLFAWRNRRMLKFLPPPSAAQARLQFPLPDNKGTLHLTITHGKRLSDKKGVMVMDFTARGPGRTDWSDMEPWFSVAHEWIVNGFTDVTTGEAHTRWERER